MTGISGFIKRILPKPIKRVLRPVYLGYLQLKKNLLPQSYATKLATEVGRFEQETEVNDLPDIFHYWSNKYLLPKFAAHGFNNPNEFFLKYAAQTIKNKAGTTSILSIGAGNCDTEVGLATALRKMGHGGFVIDCMDINESMFERGKQLAKEQQVDHHLAFLPADFNHWEASKTYDLIIANQSLHHVVALEHLFDNINRALSDQGKFITSDVIGRNGHKRWPEALKLIQGVWRDMPDRYKFNHAMQRFEKKYINHDCSTEGFEGIRAQDVLPLLNQRFDFELFVPYANLILVFIDRNFGPNFDPTNAADLAFIDRLHELDEQHLTDGSIKPTQMLAVMGKKSSHHASQQPPPVNLQAAIRKP